MCVASFGVELSSLFEVEQMSAPTVVLTIIEAVETKGEWVWLEVGGCG